MNTNAAHSRTAWFDGRGDAVRTDCVCALRELLLHRICVFMAQVLFAVRLPAPCARVSDGFDTPAAPVMAGAGFLTLRGCSKRVSHACCKLNKAPPLPA